MNYQKIYDALMDRAKCRRLTEYVERHHVLPRCMGGGNEFGNIVELTPEEHFLAHKLLVKLYPDNWKVAFGLLAMSMSKDGSRPNNKLFGWTRRRVSAAIGLSRRGQNRPEWIAGNLRTVNLGRKLSPEHRAKISAANKGKPKSAEHNAKVSAALMGRKTKGMTGRKHSDETKAKLSAAASLRNQTVETRQRMREAYERQTPEERSARARKAWETKRRKAKELGQSKG